MASAGYLADKIAERLRTSSSKDFKVVMEEVLREYGDEFRKGLRSEIGRILARRRNGKSGESHSTSTPPTRESWSEKYDIY